MKILIVINGYRVSPGITNQVNRLCEEFIKRDVKVEVKKNTELFVYIDNGNVLSTLPKYDLVVYLDKDRYIAKMLEKSGNFVVNSSKALELCDDKMLTHIILANHNIKMPLTISSPLCFNDDGNRDFIKEVENKLSFPLIIKENYGSLGRQVYLVNDHQELLEMSEKLIHVNHIYQQFISSSRGKDYRIIVINHKVVAYMKRENKYSYLSNLSSGGTSYIIDLPQSYLDMAIKASEILELDYCGVDILEGENKEPILSEVNSNAFFEGIEKITNLNVAGAYVDYLIDKVNKKSN